MKTLEESISYLQEQYYNLDWSLHDVVVDEVKEKIIYWPGASNEDIIITVHKSKGASEVFHRHDYFYFNYAYKGNYDSLSEKYDHCVTIHENELYAGQPFAGHALCMHDNRETVIIGLLVQKHTFFKAFLPMISSNSQLFHFFLDPSTNRCSDTFLHFKVEDTAVMKALLEIMVIEYADKGEDTQEMLRPLSLSFLMQVARQYARQCKKEDVGRLSDRILQYISEHLDAVTLKDIASHFSYHPNYISALLHKELGKTFSEILLKQRMERAALLLKGTELSIEEIAEILGYSNSSNFYKAFREYYHQSPRNYFARK
ncbi:MAG: helix-turn-helix transcriptional regulator [Lachnospiraceae bacterium]